MKNNFLYFFYLIVVLIGLTYYLKFHSYRYFPDFQIHIPNNFSVHGIDVSKHQGEINWKKVAQNNIDGVVLKFVFIKASEGGLLKDKRFNENWIQSKENGFIRGAYHYFSPYASPEKQANNFLSVVNLESADLPAVLDIEEFSGNKEEFRMKIKNWLDIVEKETKIKPIIYTNSDFIKNYLEQYFDDYPLWIAHYYEKKPNTNKNWYFWQHNDSGSVNGIKEKVDFNVFNGTFNELQSICRD
ncbi:MAG: glycoside hydrolase family 25 protein [Solirubrobacteraceae bacterium]